MLSIHANKYPCLHTRETFNLQCWVSMQINTHAHVREKHSNLQRWVSMQINTYAYIREKHSNLQCWVSMQINTYAYMREKHSNLPFLSPLILSASQSQTTSAPTSCARSHQTFPSADLRKNDNQDNKSKDSNLRMVSNGKRNKSDTNSCIFRRLHTLCGYVSSLSIVTLQKNANKC